MKLMNLVLIGGLAYLLLSPKSSASNQPAPTIIPTYETNEELDTTEPGSYQAQQSALTAHAPDLKTFVAGIKEEIVEAGFSSPVLNVPLNMAYDNRIKSQLIEPVFDARISLEHRMQAYLGSGYPVPPALSETYATTKSFERTLTTSITNYFNLVRQRSRTTIPGTDIPVGPNEPIQLGRWYNGEWVY